MKNKKTLVLVCAILVTVLCVSVILTGCTALNKAKEKAKEIVDSATENLEFEFKNSSGLKLEAADALTNEGNGHYVDKELKAIITPIDAPNQNVTWTIEWYGEPEEENAPVSDYVILRDSDIVTRKYVRCIKGFLNSKIVITATTEDGGFTADCLVTYTGIPTTANRTYQGTTYGMNEIIPVTTAVDNSIVFSLTNGFNLVAPKYNQMTIVSSTVKGKINARKKVLINGTVTESEDLIIDFENTLIFDEIISASYFADISLVGNSLRIAGKGVTFETFRKPTGAVRTGTVYEYVSPWTDPRGDGTPLPCYIQVHLREEVSQMEFNIRFKIIPSVQSLSLSPYVISF